MRKQSEEKIAFALLTLPALIAVTLLFFLLFDIITKALPVISWEFLTEYPKNQMREGGIFPAIIGTFLLSIGSILISFPIGVGAGVYLTEYAKKGKMKEIIEMGIGTLAGVPSIVFGLFGFAVFVIFFGFGASILAGSLTLGIMTLPTIIKTSEEALRSVPSSFREASLALGATKWEMITTSVLPYALPGILTGTILGLSRAAGETAPILFTVAVYFLPYLPSSIFHETMALPYHLYILSTQSVNIKEVLPVQYGTALVLLFIILALNSVAILLRAYYRRKYRW